MNNDRLILTNDRVPLCGAGGTVSFILNETDYKKFRELQKQTGMNTATLGRILMAWVLARTEFKKTT